MTPRPRIAPLLLFLVGLLIPGAFGAAQVVTPERGVVGTELRLRQLDGIKRVLLIGAHPDDEDTSLISTLARGWGTDVGYLSLSRGEGGQNLIGPELDEGLGIVRTGELLAARELDGGRQFFSRAFDFGYSKSADETFGYWPREELLADVVWTVRSFRPQVIVSIFPPTPEAGHGQHEVAGVVAHEAFEAAADPERFPEQLQGPEGLEPWTPLKLYHSARFDPEDASSTIETGNLDPLLGRSHFQLAMESRSQHRSQDMGAAESPGPRNSYLELVRTRVGEAGSDDGVFSGVDTTLASVARDLPWPVSDRVRESLDRYRGLVREARSRVGARPEGAARSLAGAVDALQAARAETGPGSRARRVLDRKLSVAGEALAAAAGIVVEVRSDDDLVVPGEELTVQVLVWNGGSLRVEEARPSLLLPGGWEAELVEPADAEENGWPWRSAPEGGERVRTGPAPVPAGTLSRWNYRVRVPTDADVSRLYYLERPREGEMYRWPGDRSLWGLPRNPPVVEGRVEIAFAPDVREEVDDPAASESTGVVLERAAGFVGVDGATGEFRRPLLVTPAVSVRTRPELTAWPLDRREERSVTVSIRNQARDGFRGEVSLQAPDGWGVDPGEVSLRLDEPGEERSISFAVTPPDDPSPGRHRLRAEARREDGRTFTEGFEIVDYPHFDRDLLFGDAEVEVSMFPVRTDPGLRVGYVMGSGDAGAEALEQLGVDVELLGPEAVREGAFAPYDAIVLGVRAYETRPDLVGSNGQLLDWVRDGGTLIVQYNRYGFSGAGLAPHPVTIDRPHDRVTDPTAPVTLLAPDSPVFTGPNRISSGDFEGWAQERGLYFLSEWDDAYTPLLEMADPGEDPKRGSLLVTPLGDGLWVYTGLAFFRQFPEGVPGAYRLFANLVSLDAEEWTAHHGGPGGSP